MREYRRIDEDRYELIRVEKRLSIRQMRQEIVDIDEGLAEKTGQPSGRELQDWGEIHHPWYASREAEQVHREELVRLIKLLEALNGGGD